MCGQTVKNERIHVWLTSNLSCQRPVLNVEILHAVLWQGYVIYNIKNWRCLLKFKCPEGWNSSRFAYILHFKSWIERIMWFVPHSVSYFQSWGPLEKFKIAYIHFQSNLLNDYNDMQHLTFKTISEL